jgi:hypothetical protein
MCRAGFLLCADDDEASLSVRMDEGEASVAGLA